MERTRYRGSALRADRAVSVRRRRISPQYVDGIAIAPRLDYAKVALSQSANSNDRTQEFFPVKVGIFSLIHT